MIRPAMLDDVPAIARVHVDAWRTAYTRLLPSTVLDDLSYEQRETMWRAFVGARDIRKVFVVHEATDVIGFAACGPNRTADPRYPGELYAIYLLADKRGGGHGRALFDATSTYLRAEALWPFAFWVFAGNTAVDRFCNSLGGRRFASQPTVVAGEVTYEHAYGFGSP